MREASDDEVEVFRPTTGRVMGALALPTAGFVVLVALLDGPGGFGPRTGAVAVLLGVLAWASSLRPRVVATPDHLVLRNMLETVSVPWAAIEQIAVRQVLAVRAGDRRFVSPALGRPLRKVLRGVQPVDPFASGAQGRAVTDVPYADYVEAKVRRRAEEAREAAGVRLGSDEQLALADGVRRDPAWLPLGLLALAVAAVVAGFLL